MPSGSCSAITVAQIAHPLWFVLQVAHDEDRRVRELVAKMMAQEACREDLRAQVSVAPSLSIILTISVTLPLKSHTAGYCGMHG